MEWKYGIESYTQSRINYDFYSQFYNLQYRKYIATEKSQPHFDDTFGSSKIEDSNSIENYGFELSVAQRAAILSNWVYYARHSDFDNSKIASEPDIMMNGIPFDFPNGFQLWYLSLRTENDVSVKWAIIGHIPTNTLYLVFTGTDVLVDAMIDLSFTPQPLLINPNMSRNKNKNNNDNRNGNNVKSWIDFNPFSTLMSDDLISTLTNNKKSRKNRNNNNDNIGVVSVDNDGNMKNEKESQKIDDKDNNNKNSNDEIMMQMTKWSDETEDSTILVHGGIGGNIGWLYDNITNALEIVLNEQFKYNTGGDDSGFNKIVVTGHSLGGGYATVMAARMISHWHMLNITIKRGAKVHENREKDNDKGKGKADYLLDLNVFTFGAPLTLTGNVFHSHINLLSKNLYNFVNRFDIVPRLLGDHIDRLYPSFWWNDELLINKMKSFFPIGNYYFLHNYNQIVPLKRPEKLRELPQHTVSVYEILSLLPNGADKDSFASTIFELFTSILIGPEWKRMFDYFFWFSFANVPLLNDHSMDAYLQGIGDFSSKISLVNYPSLCVDGRLNIIYCDKATFLQHNKNKNVASGSGDSENNNDNSNRNSRYVNYYDDECNLHWRWTALNQLQNVRTRHCLHIEWQWNWRNWFEWIPRLRLTRRCDKDVTQFDYSPKDMKMRAVHEISTFMAEADSFVSNNGIIDTIQEYIDKTWDIIIDGLFTFQDLVLSSSKKSFQNNSKKGKQQKEMEKHIKEQAKEKRKLRLKSKTKITSNANNDYSFDYASDEIVETCSANNGNVDDTTCIPDTSSYMPRLNDVSELFAFKENENENENDNDSKDKNNINKNKFKQNRVNRNNDNVDIESQIVGEQEKGFCLGANFSRMRLFVYQCDDNSDGLDFLDMNGEKFNEMSHDEKMQYIQNKLDQRMRHGSLRGKTKEEILIENVELEFRFSPNEICSTKVDDIAPVKRRMSLWDWLWPF